MFKVILLTKRLNNYCSKTINAFYYTKNGMMPLGNLYYLSKILIWRLRAKPILQIKTNLLGYKILSHEIAHNCDLACAQRTPGTDLFGSAVDAETGQANDAE